MNSSFYRSDDSKSNVYKGSVGAIRDCVAGHLLFLSDKQSSQSFFGEAIILVAGKNELSDFLISASDTSCVIAAVSIGEPPDAYALREAERIGIPILTLPSIPYKHNGKIAILDASKSTLFIDPDIDTLSKYASSFGACSHELYNISAPLAYIAFNATKENQKPIGALHVCSAGRRGEMRSEDELFDDYRDLCESVRPLSLTLLLCPAYPMNDSAKERFLIHTKAIFRAAVYGEIRILCGGPCALSVSGAKACLDSVFEAKEAMQESAREQNTKIKVGLIISSMHMLCSLDKLPHFDFLCLDVDKLCRSFFGTHAYSSLSNEAFEEFAVLIEKLLRDGKCISRITSAILDGETKKAIPKTDVFNGIAEFFFSNSP